MKTSTALGVALIIILGAGYFVSMNAATDSVNVVKKDNTQSNVKEGGQNSEIKDGVQYVTIVARGGYAPRKSVAMADIPTKFIIKTSGTYDCSASLAIHSLNFRQVLPNTDDTIIDAGVPKVGDTIQGICAMGMYSFAIQFK